MEPFSASSAGGSSSPNRGRPQPGRGSSLRELPSMHMRPGLLSQPLRSRHLLLLGIIIAFVSTNVTLFNRAGSLSFLYLGLAFLIFLLPTAVVCAQLFRLFPGEGAVYLWANKAFGSFWNTFLGFFCHWLPGLLGMSIGAVWSLNFARALWPQFFQASWMQGVVCLVVLLVSLLLCSLPLRSVLLILGFIFSSYVFLVLMIGGSAIFWLAGGHPAHITVPAFTNMRLVPFRWPFFAAVIASLVGLEAPLNMGGELQERKNIGWYLFWAVVLVTTGYLFMSFSSLSVLPAQAASDPLQLVSIPGRVFLGPAGQFMQQIANILMLLYSLAFTMTFNLVFSRLLLVVAIDHRLPRFFRCVTRVQVPFNAMLVQTILNMLMITGIFVVVPLFWPAKPNLSTLVYLLITAGSSVIWNLSLIGLFFGALIIFWRYHKDLADKRLLPIFVLILSAIVGSGAAAIAMYGVLFGGSPLPSMLNDEDWTYWVLLIVLSALALGAAYSFLAPEAEDLVALLNETSPVNVPAQGPGLASQLLSMSQQTTGQIPLEGPSLLVSNSSSLSGSLLPPEADSLATQNAFGDSFGGRPSGALPPNPLVKPPLDQPQNFFGPPSGLQKRPEDPQNQV